MALEPDGGSAALRSRPVDEIDTEVVLGVLKPIWIEKPETAARLRGRIEAVLDAAKAQGYRSGENPAAWRGHLSHLLPRRSKFNRGHHAAMAYGDIPALMDKVRADLGWPLWRSKSAFSPRRARARSSARNGQRSVGRKRSGPSRRPHEGGPGTQGAAFQPGHGHLRKLIEVAYLRFCLSQPAREASTFTRRNGKGSDPPWVADATVHGFRSAFRDWAGNETNFPREVAEAALAHVIGDKAEQAYRRATHSKSAGRSWKRGRFAASRMKNATSFD